MHPRLWRPFSTEDKRKLLSLPLTSPPSLALARSPRSRSRSLTLALPRSLSLSLARSLSLELLLLLSSGHADALSISPTPPHIRALTQTQRTQTHANSHAPLQQRTPGSGAFSTGHTSSKLQHAATTYPRLWLIEYRTHCNTLQHVSGYELTHFHHVTQKRDAVANICSGYVADNVHKVLCSRKQSNDCSGRQLEWFGNWRAQQRQRKQFGNRKAHYGRKQFRLSLCSSKQSDDCSRKSLHKRGAAGRACKSVAQQEEPVQAWQSRISLQKRGAAGRACTSVAQHKSLHKRGAAQEPAQAWRAKIIVTEQTEQEQATLTQPSHRNNIRGETSITIIGGQGNNISGETATNHNHSEKIDAEDETVSQHRAYGAMKLVENAEEQKPDNEPTRNIGAVWMKVNISSYHQHFKIHTHAHLHIFIHDNMSMWICDIICISEREYHKIKQNIYICMCIYIYIYIYTHLHNIPILHIVHNTNATWAHTSRARTTYNYATHSKSDTRGNKNSVHVQCVCVY